MLAILPTLDSRIGPKLQLSKRSLYHYPSRCPQQAERPLFERILRKGGSDVTILLIVQSYSEVRPHVIRKLSSGDLVPWIRATRLATSSSRSNQRRPCASRPLKSSPKRPRNCARRWKDYRPFSWTRPIAKAAGRS